MRTARGFVREPTGLWYLGTGDHSPELLDEWLETIVELAADGLRITAIEPEKTWLHFEGRDMLYADADCRIELSQPASITDEAGTPIATDMTAFELQAGTRYRLLEAPEEGPQ